MRRWTNRRFAAKEFICPSVRFARRQRGRPADWRQFVLDLRESGHAGIKVLFNEGSMVALKPGTRGRLRAVNKEGALVNIEHGTASFQVTPNNSRRWLVDVGPFLVTVKGTVFTVSWDPLREQFELGLLAD